MNCESCGAKNNDDARFCVQCGKPLQQEPAEAEINQSTAPEQHNDKESEGHDEELKGTETVEIKEDIAPTQISAEPEPIVLAEPEEVKKKGFRKIIIAAAVAAVLLIAVVFISLSAGGNSKAYMVAEHNFRTFPAGLLSNDGSFIEVEEEYWRVSISLIGDTFAFINYDDELFYGNEKSVRKIADDVENFVISDNGNYILYLQDVDSFNTATLYHYNAKSDTKTKISDDVNVNMPMAISPDGKSFAYVMDETDGYISINGKEGERLGKERACTKISDGGKYVYFAKLSDSSPVYYVRHQGEDIKLGEIGGYASYFIYNADYSEAAFVGDGKSYIFNGKEKVKISNSEISQLVVPENTQIKYDFFGNQYFLVYGIDSFKNKVACYSGGELALLDKEYNSTKIVSGSALQAITADGNTIFYLDKSGKLVKKKNFAKANAEAETLERRREVEGYRISRDGNYVYYLTEDEELWFIKGNGEPTKISGDVYNFVINNKGDMAYYLKDYDDYNETGELYCAKDGNEIKASGVKYDVSTVAKLLGIIYCVDEDGALYYSKGNENFEKIYDDIYDN